jgi:hypothetical protein
MTQNKQNFYKAKINWQNCVHDMDRRGFNVGSMFVPYEICVSYKISLELVQTFREYSIYFKLNCKL